MPGLKARGVHEHKLFAVARQNAVDAVTRALALTRHNGYFAANQGVGQRGFPHVGPANQGNKPAIRCGVCHFVSWITATGNESCAARRPRAPREPPFPDLGGASGSRRVKVSMANSAAPCSAARRLVPLAVTAISGRSIRHSTSKS